MSQRVSEFRLYGYIIDRLKEAGWDTRKPESGGKVYTQNEALHDPLLKKAFGRGRPENVVVIGKKNFWVIEAKASWNDLKKAVNEAKERARRINSIQKNACQIVTGVAGDPNTTHYVQTHCLVGERWRELKINERPATGFITRTQAETLLENDGRLDSYEIDDALFSSKIREINGILHNGAIHKRGRAEVLSCLLLALANEPRMRVSNAPRTLISDINTRAKAELAKHGKDNFFKEIEINHPTSPDNHTKNQQALAQSIEKLRDLNIISAINSGRDVLGQCYEEFLKYANDAKEIGIVLTPRHITNFAARAIGVCRNDVVFDPTCGTGGFLVAALDKVRKDGDINKFKKGNLHGVEQDPFIATLAIINMVFRGDGSSNIKEGNALKMSPPQCNKVLMNPPFAMSEYEWQFVDKALEGLCEGGLLFAILPASVMCSSATWRGEQEWRRNMLKKHTLLAVITLPEELFHPQVFKGTYGVIIRAGRPHQEKYKVLWAIMYDGVIRTKTKTSAKSNMDVVSRAVGNYLATGTIPKYIEREIDCTRLMLDSYTPENHIGLGNKRGQFDISTVKENLLVAQKMISPKVSDEPKPIPITDNCIRKPLKSFFKSVERGGSGRAKHLLQKGGRRRVPNSQRGEMVEVSGGGGDLPLISTSEKCNGVTAMIRRSAAYKIYPPSRITISANGGSCYAHYHNYEFAANSDVYVCAPKKDFKSEKTCILLCAAINEESWRYNYYKKFSRREFDELLIKIPRKVATPTQ